MPGHERREQIRSLDGCHFPVLIIGGGINGAGVFRDLAVNGVKSLVVERSDFCSGSSAAPSRLIHGGLRYLENGEFRLVAESTRERNLLLKNASHVVKPLPTTVPITTWMSGLFPAALRFLRLSDASGARGAGIVKIGLMIYDWLGRRDKVLPSHHMLGKKKSLERLPLLRPDIVATATYYDAHVTHPERLCYEVISDGLSANNESRAVNYLSVVKQHDGQITLRDEVSGETVVVRADIICNAAGPWIDRVNVALGRKTQYIGGSKGSHIVLQNGALRDALDGRMIYFETNDRRICLVYAISDKVLLGTTDLRIDNPDNARCEDDEVDYLFGALRDVMPGVEVSKDQVVYRFSGVRPLPKSEKFVVGQVSRDHAIEIDEADSVVPVPVLSLVGGKWTTFRAFSEQVADQIFSRLGRKRDVSTDQLKIGGGTTESSASSVDAIAARHKLSPSVVASLYSKYGDVPRLYDYVARPGGQQELTTLPGYLSGEVSYLTACENVVHLSDLILRRSTIAMNGLVTSRALDELAAVCGSAVGWDDAMQASEVAASKRELAQEHGVVFDETVANTVSKKVRPMSG